MTRMANFSVAALLVWLSAGCERGSDVHLGNLVDGSASPDRGAVDLATEGDLGEGYLDADTPDGGPATDAATADAHLPDATGPDAGTCACGPQSCGTRTCGRSACGYPCGSCGQDQWCNQGACDTGVGPGTTCSDAFQWYGYGGGAVWEGDTGLRLCPGDPSKVELCTCSGGGADAWINCSGACFTPCVGNVACGSTTCGPLEYCQTCGSGSAAPTHTCRARKGSNGSCPSPTAPMVFDVFCDDPGDCGANERCSAVRGDIIRVTCERDAPAAVCDELAFYRPLCASKSECAACGGTCEPVAFADLTSPSGTGVKACK